MIIIRNCFVAKPGNASKLAAQLKEAAVAMQMPNFRILTDMTGDFNRVVMEYSAESLTEFEGRLRQYMTDPVLKEKMKGYTDLYTTGYREVMQVM
jgi:hypothetical protein